MAESEVLRTAEEIIFGERAKTYGDAKTSFSTIADFWTTYINKVLMDQNPEAEFSVVLSGHEVAMMMILMKVSRTTGSYHIDNYIDIAGYAALAGTEL